MNVAHFLYQLNISLESRSKSQAKQIAVNLLDLSMFRNWKEAIDQEVRRAYLKMICNLVNTLLK